MPGTVWAASSTHGCFTTVPSTFPVTTRSSVSSTMTTYRSGGPGVTPPCRCTCRSMSFRRPGRGGRAQERFLPGDGTPRLDELPRRRHGKHRDPGRFRAIVPSAGPPLRDPSRSPGRRHPSWLSHPALGRGRMPRPPRVASYSITTPTSRPSWPNTGPARTNESSASPSTELATGRTAPSGEEKCSSPAMPVSIGPPTCATSPCPAVMPPSASPTGPPSPTCERRASHGPPTCRRYGPRLAAELRALERQLERQSYCVPTSSMGRLFDAVSSLLDLRHTVSYEAQAAMELETAVAAGASGVEGPAIGSVSTTATSTPDLSCRPWSARSTGSAVRRRHGAAFHATVARLIAELADELRETTGINTVALSGGVFQNVLVTQLARAELVRRGLRRPDPSPGTAQRRRAGARPSGHRRAGAGPGGMMSAVDATPPPEMAAVPESLAVGALALGAPFCRRRHHVVRLDAMALARPPCGGRVRASGDRGKTGAPVSARRGDDPGRTLCACWPARRRAARRQHRRLIPATVDLLRRARAWGLTRFWLGHRSGARRQSRGARGLDRRRARPARAGCPLG